MGRFSSAVTGATIGGQIGGPIGAIAGGLGGLLFGGGDSKPPPLDPVSQRIQQEQLRQLIESGELQTELQPFQLAQLGFTRDEDGTLRQMTQEERFAGLTPAQRLEQQNRELLQQRFGQALGPGLPSPALERDIERQRALLGEDIARRGQIGGTAEAQRTGAFQEASLIARDVARRGDISNLAQLGLQLETGQANLLSQRLAQLRGQPLGAIPLIQAGGVALQPGLQQQRLATGLQESEATGTGQLLGTLLGGMPRLGIPTGTI